jgi:hypothetical protein
MPTTRVEVGPELKALDLVQLLKGSICSRLIHRSRRQPFPGPCANPCEVGCIRTEPYLEDSVVREISKRRRGCPKWPGQARDLAVALCVDGGLR